MDPLDLLTFLELEGARAVLWRGKGRMLEGSLLDIALYVEEHPAPDYRLQLDQSTP